MRDFLDELELLDEVFGFDPQFVKQGDRKWHIMRSGVVTASRADCLLAKKGTQKRDGYLAELVGEVCTGVIKEEVSAKSLEWGKKNEQNARNAYSFSMLSEVSDIPFIYKDKKMRFGCSPDGICETHGLEIKCPFSTKNHIDFVCSKKIKTEYLNQCQFSMWVTGIGEWHFASFDPRMRNKRLHISIIERDEEIMSKFDELCVEFITDMDNMIKKIGLNFGDQWSCYV